MELYVVRRLCVLHNTLETHLFAVVKYENFALFGVAARSWQAAVEHIEELASFVIIQEQQKSTRNTPPEPVIVVQLSV